MKRQLLGKLNGAPHLVPLPKQAVAVLRELQPLTGGGKLVFRGERHHDRPMSDNTLNAALRAMGYAADEMTAHGFRATARTILHERLGFSPDVIEAQLAHSVRDSLGRPITGRSSSTSAGRCCRPGPTISISFDWMSALHKEAKRCAQSALAARARPTSPCATNSTAASVGRQSTCRGATSVVSGPTATMR